MNVCRSIAVAVALLVVTTLSLKMRGVQAQTACSDENPPPAIPFTDVTSFCHEIAQAFFTGLTNGTSPTTYSPTNTTTRGEMAAFINQQLPEDRIPGFDAYTPRQPVAAAEPPDELPPPLNSLPHRLRRYSWLRF